MSATEPNCIDYLNFITQLCTLGVTIYFTSQLVGNDNEREERSRLEKLQVKFKNRLSYAARQAGLLQGAGITLGKQYPKYKHDILAAYEDFYATQYPQEGLIKPDKFLESLRAIDPDGNW